MKHINDLKEKSFHCKVKGPRMRSMNDMSFGRRSGIESGRCPMKARSTGPAVDRKGFETFFLVKRSL